MAKRTTPTRKIAKKRTTKKAASAGSVSASTSGRKKAKASTAKKTVKKATKAVKKAAKKADNRSTAKKSPASATARTKKPTRSTKKATGGTTRRSTTARKAAGDNGDMPVPAPPPKPIRTRLKDKDLNEFRELLLDKRRELAGDVMHLENEARDHHSGGNSSPMPLHMADLGTDTWEQELTLGLIETERSVLREIDEALERIENRTYGICLGTGRVITKTRLRARPWAKYCIDYARKRELGLV